MRCIRTGSRMSRTSVLLPLPLTPVMATKQPSGMRTSMLRRLCSRAPLISSHSRPGTRRCCGTGMYFLPARYCPVIDSLTLVIPFTGPL